MQPVWLNAMQPYWPALWLFYWRMQSREAQRGSGLAEEKLGMKWPEAGQKATREEEENSMAALAVCG